MDRHAAGKCFVEGAVSMYEQEIQGCRDWKEFWTGRQTALGMGCTRVG